MQQIMRLDEEEVKQPEAIKPSKISYSTTAIVRMDKSFMDIMKAIICCASAFELQYGMPFMQTGIKDIVEDTVP